MNTQAKPKGDAMKTKGSQYTPGPWKVKEYRQMYSVIGPDMKECVCTFPPADNAYANARLIAAAPELLEACRKGLARVKELTALAGHAEGYSYETVRVLADAIAKAEGRKCA